MKEFERYRVKLFPTKEQYQIALSFVNASRYAWNWALNEINIAHQTDQPYPNNYTLSTRFTQFKRQPGNEWLRQVSARCMKGSFRRIHLAMVDFFNGIKGRPKFKKKRGCVGSFDTHEGTTKIENRRIRCEKLGWIRCAKHNIPNGEGITYNTPSIVIDHGNMYFSVGVKYSPAICINTNEKCGVIGIDLGIKTPAVASNGMVCTRVNTDSLWRRLKRKRRKLSKHYKTMVEEAERTKTKFSHIPKSSRTERLETQVSKLHGRISNKLSNNVHQFTSSIIKENPVAVVLETIDIPKIIGSVINTRHALEACMGEMRRQLEYKCLWNDILVIKAPADFPSTQMCSQCGYVKSTKTGDKMTVEDRLYICPKCGATIDRDENSSYVLRDYGYMYLDDPDAANTFYKFA